MRRLILLTAIAALAVAVGSAAAKTVTVTITKNGYVPSSTAIVQGDTVQFTNSDTVVHQVTFKSTAGVTCTPNPLVVQPGSNGSCTFASAGNYTYSDPNAKGNAFKGTVTVSAAPASLSLTAKPLIVVYGGSSVLSGVLSTQKVGENIDVLAQQCGATAPTKLTTVQTTAGGAYTTAAKPLMNTVYTAKSKALSSAAVTVRVRPSLRLTKLGSHRFSVRVSAGSSFSGKYASFQRFSGTLHRWVAVKVVRLGASTAGVAPTVVSAASFRASVASGLRVRVTLPQPQVGSCYAPGTSNTILS
jgi:plastocyanin